MYKIYMKYRIDEILRKRKITAYQFSKFTLIEMRTLLRIINNEVRGCNNDTLDKIARALDVSIDELFDREGRSDEGSH